MRRKNGVIRIQTILLGLIVLAGMALSPVTGAAQDDEQRRFLEVRRRQVELQSARKQLQRSEDLLRQGLVPQKDVDRDRDAVSTAQINYQQSVLALLDLQPRISVQSAIKTRDGEGRKFVTLTVKNLTPKFDDTQFTLLNNFDGADPIPDALRTRDVSDVFVALREGRASSGTEAGQPTGASPTISLPYEVHIPQMKYGETKTLKFQMLRDADSVIVALAYRNSVREVPVQLQHSENGNQIDITSAQPSQEADLGSQAVYNLTFERPTVDIRSFQLKVVNLPRQITASFVDAQSQARLSQINFSAGVTRQALGLRLYVPEQADEHVRVDRPVEFWGLALNDEAAKRFEADRVYTEAEMAEGAAGRIKFVLIPRGVGKITVTAPSLFSEVLGGQAIDSELTIRNTGTRRLDNVKPTAEFPLNWRVEFAPDLIPALEMNSEKTLALRIFPPAEANVGDYEVRIKTDSFADNRKVQSEDKLYRVSVKAKTNLAGTSAVVGGLVVLVFGMVLFGVKLAKR